MFFTVPDCKQHQFKISISVILFTEKLKFEIHFTIVHLNHLTSHVNFLNAKNRTK